jgi:GT2 family glycosyltransferase
MTETLQPKIFIIVLNFNGRDVLTQCLSSVYQSDYLNFEVVVVDNNSSDESLEQAKKSFSRAYFIKNSENFGFSRGNNMGIRFALEKFAEYIFILNNDAVIEKTTLSEMVQAIQKNDSAGIASPVILDADNRTVWFAGGTIDWRKMRTNHVHEIRSDSPYQSEYISGCAMFVKKAVFREIGILDERFFLYYEDADFSMRAKKAGFDLIIVPSVRIKHLEQSNNRNNLKTYWLVLSGLMFFYTYSPNKLWLFFYVCLRKIKNFCDRVLGSNKNAHLVYKAYKDYKKLLK